MKINCNLIFTAANRKYNSRRGNYWEIVAVFDVRLWVLMSMKHVTAFLASVFMFWAVFFLVGIALSLVVPRNWWQIEVKIGLFYANILSMIAFILGGITATYTFKASLHAKTGRLYRSKNHIEKTTPLPPQPTPPN